MDDEVGSLVVKNLVAPNHEVMSRAAVKPTTMAGILDLNVEAHKMKCVNPTDIKSSAELSRWAPGTMSMVTEALLTQVIHRKPKLAPLSWQEHLQHGHAMSLSGVIGWFVNRVCNSNLLTEKSNILLMEFCPSTPQGHLSELTTCAHLDCAKRFKAQRRRGWRT